MPSDPPFAEFIHRIRQGDEQAAAELVRRYEPAIRLEVRMRLGRNDPAGTRSCLRQDVRTSRLTPAVRQNRAVQKAGEARMAFS
jgi:hypothetical protein